MSATHFYEQYPPEKGMAHVIGTTDNTGRIIGQNTIRVTSTSNNERIHHNLLAYNIENARKW